NAAHLARHDSPTRRSTDLPAGQASIRPRLGSGRRMKAESSVIDRANRRIAAVKEQGRKLVERERCRHRWADHLIRAVQRYHVSRDRKSTRLNSSHVKISYA